jgi:hypothetical protein
MTPVESRLARHRLETTRREWATTCAVGIVLEIVNDMRE